MAYSAAWYDRNVRILVNLREPAGSAPGFRVIDPAAYLSTRHN